MMLYQVYNLKKLKYMYQNNSKQNYKKQIGLSLRKRIMKIYDDDDEAMMDEMIEHWMGVFSD